MTLHRRRSQQVWDMPVEESLYAYLVAFYVQTLLYGIYVALFVMSTYLLYKKKGTTQRVFLMLGILMFSLATGDIGLTHYYLFQQLLRGQDPVLRLKHIYVKILLFVGSHAIAVAVLILRCYAVWGRKQVLILPLILLLISTIIGYTVLGLRTVRLEEYMKIYLWLSFSTSAVVTCLTAVQICLIFREMYCRLGPGLVNTPQYLTAVVTESGILYPIYLLLALLVESIVFPNSLTQVVGIVPTILIVRVGLGRHTRSVQKTLSDCTTLTNVINTTGTSTTSTTTHQHTDTTVMVELSN